MKPGRELDALIVEKVIGWKPFKKKWEAGAHRGYHDAWLDGEGREVCIQCPEYSTDIAAAWVVVEKLRESKKTIALSSVYHQTANPYWSWICRIEWTDKRLGYQTSIGLSESVPHAICLAALDSIGIKK